MNWTFSRICWDAEQQRPAVMIEAIGAPASVQVRFDSYGADDEQADTMFVITDETEDVKQIWRPEVLHIVVLEAVIERESFTLNFEGDPRPRTVEVGVAECERLRGVVADLSASNSALMLTAADR